MNNAIMSLAAAIMAFGAIDVPPELNPYDPVIATVDAVIPDGATFDGGWDVSDGARMAPGVGNTVHVWAKPGTYTLSFSGLWIHLKEVKFKDGDGNEITIMSYLGHDYINDKANFTVLGGTEPDPILPQPTGKKQLVFFVAEEDLESLPSGQQAILTSLSVRKDLADRGHVFSQVIDDDQIKQGVSAKWLPFIKVVSGDTLPRVAMAPVDGGAVEDYPLPATYDELLKLLGEK